MCYASSKKRDYVCYSHLSRHFFFGFPSSFIHFLLAHVYAKRYLPPGSYHTSRFQQFPHQHQPRRSQSIPCKYYQHPSSLLLRSTARHALEFPRVLPRHARLVPGAFAAFPEAVAFLADETGVAEAAVFGAVVLLAGACVNFMSVAPLGWWRVAWFRTGSAQGRAFGLCHGMGWSLQKPL